MDQVVTPSLPATPDGFLAWEAFHEGKFEFDGHVPVPMNGGTAAHARIERNILAALKARPGGSRCEAFGSTMKVRCGTSFRYPDASVTCTPIPGDSVVAERPVLLFEVVSPGSETIDRGVKVSEYCALDSLRHYLIVEQGSPSLTAYRRVQGGWVAGRGRPGRIAVVSGAGRGRFRCPSSTRTCSRRPDACAVAAVHHNH